ncbi:MAG: GNAT family N-acetyltransferase [Erysipelotrichaceae bacterium]
MEALEAVYGDSCCIGLWMQLVRKVSGNFPGLETEERIKEHQQTVLKFMDKKQALCIKSQGAIIGVLLFSRNKNMICCLAVDPQHRRQSVASILLKKALDELDRSHDITVSTFRENDEKGIAPRLLYQKFGFQPGELTEEFGYPNQIFVLHPNTDLPINQTKR